MAQPQPPASPDVAPPPPPQPPDAPIASPATALPVSAGFNFPVSGIPRTQQELAALRARRSELSDQLNSATNRRTSLAQRLRSQNGPADGADRAGLEQHLQLLDRRILQLESDIAVTGQQLAAAPATLIAGSSASPRGGRGLPPEGAAALGGLFILCVLMPMAITFARLMWRRGSRPTPSRESAETVQRLMRLETAVDSIAIEMERVSEGQRFVTRLLSESQVSPRFDGARETMPVLAAMPAARAADVEAGARSRD
ncbi:MAG: hypothetical protein JO180_01380 [Gemmatirosa sp.]|nr:hypothetical protein [Gemmatirosa sp.]